jgi:RNA polymerase sigma-70 factor (ECF subfamily)
MFNREERKKKKEFEMVYDKHVEQIFRFVFLKVSSKDDAEDVTSKVFIRVWEAMQKEKDRYKPEIKNYRAFIYKIARNMVIDYYRQNRPEMEEKDAENQTKLSTNRANVSLDDIVAIDKEMRADERAIFNSEIEEVKKALKNLNDDYQNVIIWYYLDELTASEIADLLEKTEVSVRVLIYRAMDSLRQELNIKK